MKHAIVFSTAYFPLVGGAEVAMKEVTDRLPDWRFDLVCARIRRGLPSTERIGNVTVHRVGFGRPIDKILLPAFGAWKALRIPGSREAVAWSLMASHGGFAALAYTWLRPKTTFLLTLQEGDPLEHYAKRAGRLSWLHRRIFRRADAVHAISRFLAGWAVEMGFKGTPVVFPNGVDVARFMARIPDEERRRIRASFGFGSDDVVLVTVSRLSLKNGGDDLIRSLSHLPTRYRVLLVGEGEDTEKLTKLVAEKGLSDRVVFAGHRGHDEVPGILQASDIFCRPSLSEGLGNAFLEAMAAGIPLIGTPVGGIPDFLTDSETGVFCKVRDPESIATAARRIQEEPGLKEKLVANGEALVRKDYGWDDIARRLGGMLTGLAI
ncbi:glycosyltransferase family 4 protein [Patescibacteria group bacterium]|nr:glycosyltransferase family 4 protein [Patescibacteria group bacterium]MBU1448403.1 glycosyltransferase family 4 protein [Patescibacteria group bacterium]MBU2613037.1 glycosyltransferase family 4 protein [Patescibacteria group bacterium]